MVNAAQPYCEPAPTWPRPAQRRAVAGPVAGLWSCGPRPATELKCIGVRLRRQKKPIVRCGLWGGRAIRPGPFHGGLPPTLQ